MNRFRLRIIAILLIGVGLLFGSGAFAQNAGGSENVVRTFYAWYIEKQAHNGNPLLSSEIYKWVSKETVDSLRRAYEHDKLPGDADYFLKVQDYDEKDWLSHLSPMRAVSVADVVIVPVIFGARDRSSVVVFLQKQAGIWKITKVDDLLGYQ